MTICQHWQRGQCRYGNACRFEHPGAGGFPLGASQQTAVTGGDITNTLVQTVKVDMEQWEKGRQWTFSCYSPAKETACYPGLDDVSPEEMRFEAYAARGANTVEQYSKKVADMTAEYAGKRRALLAPTEQIKDTLRRIYNKESLVGVAPLMAVAANAASVFGGGNAGVASSSGGIFQSKPSVFGGGSSVQQPTSSGGIFGSATTTANPFGSAGAPSSSVFGGSTAQSSSIFGGAPKPATFGMTV